MTINEMGFEINNNKNFVEFEPIPKGKYYFAVHGIVGLGQRDMSRFLDKNGKSQQPVGQFRVIFEILNHKREDDENSVIHTDLNVTAGSRGKLAAFIATVLDRFPTEEEMQTKYTTVGIKEILGSVGRLTISHYQDKRGQTRAQVETKEWGFSPVDELAKPQLPKATRETFFFNPMNKDHVEIFKNNLTYWTQSSVMSALNANQFPRELHEAWAKIQLDREQKQQNNKTQPKTTETNSNQDYSDAVDWNEESI